MGVGRDAALAGSQALKESRCTVIARTVPRFFGVGTSMKRSLSGGWIRKFFGGGLLADIVAIP